MEAESCRNSGMRFFSFPIEDRSVPTSESEFKGLVESISESLRKGQRGCSSLPGRYRTVINYCRFGSDSQWLIGGLCIQRSRRSEGLPGARHTGATSMGGGLLSPSQAIGRVTTQDIPRSQLKEQAALRTYLQNWHGHICERPCAV